MALRVGDSGAQTASVLAFPGIARMLQMRWGLHTSVDDVVSENVPGAQALHSTFPFGALELATPKPGPHLLSLMHCRQLPEWVFKAQYLPASQAHTRFCCLVQARISTWSRGEKDSQGHLYFHSPILLFLPELVGPSAQAQRTLEHLASWAVVVCTLNSTTE